MMDQITIANPFLDKTYPITQRFGDNPGDYSDYGLIAHNGYDFGCPLNAGLYGVCIGVVGKIGIEMDGYGKYVRINTSWGRVIYAHLTEICVEVGQQINPGDFIGRSGNTGNSTGPHLHLEVRINGLESNGYNGAVDYAEYTDGWLDGTAGGSSQPIPSVTEQPLDVEPLGDDIDISSGLLTKTLYKVTHPNGLNIRAKPDISGELLFGLVPGRQVCAITEQVDAQGNRWVGFAVWCSVKHTGQELMKEVEK